MRIVFPIFLAAAAVSLLAEGRLYVLLKRRKIRLRPLSFRDRRLFMTALVKGRKYRVVRYFHPVMKGSERFFAFYFLLLKIECAAFVILTALAACFAVISLLVLLFRTGA
ncbi:MAG: hypothetical protein IJU70_11775 [Lentisphaeria bacterium]|nr:hypothetical protein [Lentisphaeria bacterium]